MRIVGHHKGLAGYAARTCVLEAKIAVAWWSFFRSSEVMVVGVELAAVTATQLNLEVLRACWVCDVEAFVLLSFEVPLD